MLVLENVIEKISLIGDLAEQRLSNRQSYEKVQSKLENQEQDLNLINRNSRLSEEESKHSHIVNSRSMEHSKHKDQTVNNSEVEKIVKSNTQASKVKDKVSSINSIISRELNKIAAEKSKKVSPFINSNITEQLKKLGEKWESFKDNE